MANLNPVDQLVHEMINSQAIPGFTGFFTAVTQLGNGFLWVIIFCVYLITGKKKLIAAIFILALLVSGTINEDLKGIFHRDRPQGAAEGNWLIAPGGYSLPSGHSQTSFLLATLLAAYLGWRYGLITFPIAALVGASRLYLGVHYLTDVLAGAVVGIIIGELVILSMYVNGMTRISGLIGHLVTLTGIRPLNTRVTDRQQSAVLVPLLIGLCISATAMVTGMYYLSLLILAYAYIATINLAGRYG